MNIPWRRWWRIFAIFLLETLLICLCSLLYFFIKSPIVFLLIVFLSYAISYLGPVWFMIFLKSRPYKGKYREKLVHVSKKCQVNLREIYVKPSKRSNAFATSFANNKSVVFLSNILDNHPWDEIEAVMAHELGHLKRNDPLLYTTLVAFILVFSSFTSVFLSGEIFNNSFIGVLGISIVISLFFFPIILALSRHREHYCDVFAITITKNPKAFGRFFKRMILYEERAGVKVSREMYPVSKLFLTHPWIYDRIKLMES